VLVELVVLGRWVVEVVVGWAVVVVDADAGVSRRRFPAAVTRNAGTVISRSPAMTKPDATNALSLTLRFSQAYLERGATWKD
jgi:hypothetical protein